jgi:hypothetical protein
LHNLLFIFHLLHGCFVFKCTTATLIRDFDIRIHVAPSFLSIAIFHSHVLFAIYIHEREIDFLCDALYCAICVHVMVSFVDTGESNSQDGFTALIRAATSGYAECARLLIDAGADKDAKENVRRRSLLCR